MWVHVSKLDLEDNTRCNLAKAAKDHANECAAAKNKLIDIAMASAWTRTSARCASSITTGYNRCFTIEHILESDLDAIGPYGKEEGVPFELPAAGGKILGFHARSGTLLDALGTYVKMD